jgi:SAM-dependent methyltransferase
MRLRFDPDREQAELAEYLGERFQLERLWRYQDQFDAEFSASGDEHTFYRTSEAYLYNLTAFAMTGTKLPYLRELIRRVPPGARLLDYGCGIGSDGLMLLEAGYDVAFADFDNPSTAYLRWRLRQRGLDAPIHDLDARVPSEFDAAFAYDVLEHVGDPFGLLAALEERAGLVEVNFLAPIPGDQESHHDLPVAALVRHAAAHRLHFYRVLHGRSHVVIYEPRIATRSELALNRGRVLAARLRAGYSSLRARITP